MLSTCPSCLNQVPHEDHLFEVACECGTRFNPFHNSLDAPAMEEQPSDVAGGKPLDFSQSNALFNELRDFGENLVDPRPITSNSPSKTEKTPTASKTPLDPIKTEPVVSGSATPFVITSGIEIKGFEIQTYFDPVSISRDVDLSEENPLKSALTDLGERCRSLGANALIGLSWQLSSDPLKVVLLGTPVTCLKTAE